MRLSDLEIELEAKLSDVSKQENYNELPACYFYNFSNFLFLLKFSTRKKSVPSQNKIKDFSKQ